jgi:hypothetical protein
MEVQESVAGNEVVKYTARSFTLKELAENYVDVCKRIEDAGQAVPEELEDMHVIAKDLLANKLDDVWLLMKKLEAHNEALQAQLDHNNKMMSDIEHFTRFVAEATPDKKITGNTVSFRLQKNSRGSVVVIDDTKIPLEFKKTKVEITDSFVATDKEQLRFYQSLILGRLIDETTELADEDHQKIGNKIKTETSKTLLEVKLKVGEAIDGATYEVGSHPRWQVGKVKPKKIEATNG